MWVLWLKILSLSRGKVVNAINHYKQFNTLNNLPRNVPRKSSAADDRLMVQMSKANPFFTSSQIRSEMEQKYNVIVSTRPVRRRLVESGQLDCNKKELDSAPAPVKHSGPSVVVWGCFTSTGVGPLAKIERKMNADMYRENLKDNLDGEYSENLALAWI
ncbi:uncharacterized protein LOC142236000 [Haematobia irritans]|uniref:uncharacterized protein LOC142236000 n=1 Tax=Haematobia irritans TaxID=7368 RepID=UPI003F500604